MSRNKEKHKPWGGRFTEATEQFVEKFTSSVGFDHRLYAQDIEASKAHARMLAKVGVIDEPECNQIVQGLDQVLKEIADGDFTWSVALEDVHMNVEARLIELIGEAGKKLHTGRSRNDQVATDMRLYLRGEIDSVCARIEQLQLVMVDLAEREAETIMPGFTHLQVAMPVTLGHHLMAWFQMLERDYQRMRDCRRRVNVMPLGSAALAGTSFPVDRYYCAQLLGFDELSSNSLDAVSDRDFALEFCSAAAVLMVHLSRMSEELILWTSAQFGFIELPDRFCTGSSIMPQKKNPDVPELVRGKAGRVSGNLVALLMLMKGQPLAYNKDNQEDKEPLFDTVDTVTQSLYLFAEMLPAIRVHRDRMRQAAKDGFPTATDLADYLVRRGLPFREAHETVGMAVRYALDEGKDLAGLTLQELQRFSGRVGPDVFEVLTLEGSVAARRHVGGTAPEQVRAQIRAARERLSARSGGRDSAS